MAATRSEYNPLLVSERLVKRLTLCRASTTGMAWFMSTLGEATIWPNGRQFGESKLRTLLQDARVATGEPLRKGYNQSHVTAFLKAFGSHLTIKDVIYNKSRLRIRESLQWGFAVCMAGNVAETPADSILRDLVGEVAHEMLFYDWQGGWKTGTVAVIDPMTPPGTRFYVGRVPVREMFMFGSRYKIGNRFNAERYKIGKYAKAAISHRRNAKIILDVQTKLLNAIAGREESDAEADKLLGQLNTCLELKTDPDVLTALVHLKEIEYEAASVRIALSRTVSPLR